MFHLRSVLQSGSLAWTVFLVIAGPPPVALGGEPVETVARPDAGGQATQVRLGMFVVDIAEIDDAKQIFKSDVYATLRWKDQRLASPEARRKMPLSKVWHPTLQFLNQRSVERLLPEEVFVDAQGNVAYDQRFQGAFAVPLDLHNFPLDAQVLEFRIASPGNSPTEIELVPDQGSGRADGFTIMDWKVGALTSQVDPVVTPAGHEIAGFKFTLPAQRLALAYLYQFAIPLTFIVCMSWSAFWMSSEQLGPRQGIAVTAILTIIAYRFVLASQLPRVAYLTRFDYLLLGSTTLVFAVLAEVVIAHGLQAGGRKELSRKLDLWARAVFPAIYIVLLIGVIFF